MIEFDVETTGLQFPYHHAFCWQFYDGINEPAIIWTGDRGWREEVQRWLDRAADDGLRAWNSKFDFHFADKEGFRLPDPSKWYDGMILAHALDERRQMALKEVGKSLGFTEGADLQQGVKAWLTEERKRRAKHAKETGTELVEPNYSDVPRDQMTAYALEDVLLTNKVCGVMEPQIEATPDLKWITEFEREVLAALFDVERRGFPADEEAYRHLEIEVAENLERMDDTLTKLAAVGIEDGDEFEFNPKSSKQVLNALKRRGADLQFVTNDSMDADNLETVEDELAAAILDFRAEFKILSTYVRPYIHRSWNSDMRIWTEPFITPEGRIHPNFRQVGARTGRMSCSDPNLQNQPRDDLRLRYNLRAEPGMKLVTCDLSSIEMGVFAAYAGEGRLLDAVRNHTDMHNMTADFIGLKDRQRPNGVIESRRQRGKTFNYAVVYGLGKRGMRKKFRVSMAEANLMFKRYHDAYPEVGRLQTRIEWKLQDIGYIKSAWGRRYRLSPRDAYKAVNYLVQGTCADLLKDALIKVHKQGVPVIALVHDEIIAHVPKEDAEEVKHIIIKALTDQPRLTEKIPIDADGDIVDHWSEAKDPNFNPKWVTK